MNSVFPKYTGSKRYEVHVKNVFLLLMVLMNTWRWLPRTQLSAIAIVVFQLRPLASDAPRELNILGHDRHALGVDGAEVCILEKRHNVRFSSLLQCHNGTALEPKVAFEFLRDFSH